MRATPSFFIAKRSWYPGAGRGCQKRCHASAEARSAKLQERIRNGPRSTAARRPSTTWTRNSTSPASSRKVVVR